MTCDGCVDYDSDDEQSAGRAQDDNYDDGGNSQENGFHDEFDARPWWSAV